MITYANGRNIIWKKNYRVSGQHIFFWKPPEKGSSNNEVCCDYMKMQVDENETNGYGGIYKDG
jgi:hypothetical protein